MLTVLVGCLSLAVFCGVAVVYCRFVPPATVKQADKKATRIPYEKRPENCGILCTLPDESVLFFYLDFGALTLWVDDPALAADSEAVLRCSLDSERLIDCVDRVGGLTVTENGEVLRLPGVQVADRLAQEPTAETKKEFLTAFLCAVGEYGLDESDLAFLLPDLPPETAREWVAYLPQTVSHYKMNRKD